MPHDAGREARDGFWFQDATILLRLLRDGLRRRALRAFGEEEPAPLKVAIEKPAARIGAGGTAWDSVSYYVDQVCVEGGIVLDEMKKGDISKDDRVSFWRRLRRTVADGADASLVVPRLTLGADAVDEPEKWRRLGKAAQTAIPVTVRRVASAAALAGEALWYLTSTDLEEWPTAIPEATARALLSRFEFDDTQTTTSLHQELLATMRSIGADTDPDALVDSLGGWIASIARSPDAPPVTFEHAVERLELLRRYLTLSTAAENLWRRMRTGAPFVSSQIATQSWRSVQPEAAALLDDGTSPVVLSAPAGHGKSFVLDALVARHRPEGVAAWLDATESPAISTVQEALAFGRWATARTGRKLLVVVDGLDVDNAVPLLVAVRSALEGRDAPETQLVAAMRHTTWADAREDLPAWHDVDLQPWTQDVVLGVLAHHGFPAPAPDLQELLSVPLFLDLYVRIVGRLAEGSGHASTRHRLMDSYFARILAGRHAGHRLAVVERGIDAAARGEASWAETTPEAHDLVSLGLLVNDRGRVRFRHALLRDYAAVVAVGEHSVEEICESLTRVRSSLIRADFLRALIEARIDAGDAVGIERLVAACHRHELAPWVGVSLIENPTAALIESLARIADGRVLAQTLARAQHRRNRAWLRGFSAISDSRPSWLGPALLHELGSLVVAENGRVRNLTASGEAVPDESFALARAAREWTRGISYAEAGVLLDWLWELLVRVRPDDDTLAWFGSLDLTDENERHGSRLYLQRLRALLRSNSHASKVLLAAALRQGAYAGRDPVEVFADYGAMDELAHECLLGPDGLVALRPDVAVQFVYELSALEAEASDRRFRGYGLSAADESVFLDFVVEATSEDALRASLRERLVALRQRPLRTQQQALAGLADDEPHSSDRDAKSLLFGAVNDIASRAAPLALMAADAARASNSLRARIDILAMRPQPGWHEDEAAALRDAQEAVLTDPRIYATSSHRRLWELLPLAWPGCSPATKDKIRANILALAATHVPGAEMVGSLATSIPIAERGSDLTPYVQWAESMNAATPPPWSAMRDLDESERGVPGRSDGAESPSGLSTLWRRVRAYAPQPDDGSLTIDAVDALSYGVVEDLLTPEAPWEVWLAVVMMVHRDQDQKERRLSGSVLARLFDTALSGAAQARKTGTDLRDWQNFLDIADACAAHPDHADDRAMRRRLVDEVERAASDEQDGTKYAVAALHAVRSPHWMGDDRAQAMLNSWLRDRSLTEGLEQAVAALLPAHRRDALLDLLSRTGRLDGADARLHHFFHVAGVWLARWLEHEGSGVVLARLEEWCGTAPRPGALADPSAWRQVLTGFLWWIGRATTEDWLRSHRRHRLRALFVALAPALWRARPPSRGGSGNDSVCHGLFRVLHKDKREPRGATWAAPVARLVADVLRDGTDHDVSATLFELDLDLFEIDDLSRLAEEARARLERSVADPNRRYMPHGLGELVAELAEYPRTPFAVAEAALHTVNRHPFLAKEAARAEQAMRERSRRGP